MNPKYNQDYTMKQVVSILETLQDCVKHNRYTISKNENRKKNIRFINYYNISSRKQRDLILKIKPEDFSYSLKNTNSGYEHEILYVFCPQIKLYNFDGNEEIVDIYTKFNMIEHNNSKRVIVISFHKSSKPVNYLFR